MLLIKALLSICLLIMPGWFISRVFLGNLKFLDRIVLSFALSVTVIPLLVFYASKLGMAVSFFNVIMLVALVSAAAVFTKIVIVDK